MIRSAALFGALAAATLAGSAACAQTVALIEIETVEISIDIDAFADQAAADDAAKAPPLAQYGPFRVVDVYTAELHGLVTSQSPAQFAAMRAAFPLLRELHMVECPGSDDEAANLVLARMVRAARIDTHVPAGGSVRSGAVELFLAGVRRHADLRAEFAVHSWRDDLGREAGDLVENDPVHREYLDFYREMGLSDDVARRFYALTNSVRYDDALYLRPLYLAQMGLLNIG